MKKSFYKHVSRNFSYLRYRFILNCVLFCFYFRNFVRGLCYVMFLFSSDVDLGADPTNWMNLSFNANDNLAKSSISERSSCSTAITETVYYKN